jgi:hypothetical protein
MGGLVKPDRREFLRVFLLRSGRSFWVSTNSAASRDRKTSETIRFGVASSLEFLNSPEKAKRRLIRFSGQASTRVCFLTFLD